MASCKSVVVLCPNGRRQTVKTTPAMSIVQILEEVCKKHGLDYKEFALKHQKKILDATVPVRYSGFTNNAHLELVPFTTTIKSDGKCTVALQLESGERLTKEFEPQATLWDVLTHWDTQADSPYQGTIRTRVDRQESTNKEIPLSPVCVYMAHEIQGEENLRKHSLHSLGLTGQKAVVRVLYRLLDQNKLQADSQGLNSPAKVSTDESVEAKQSEENSCEEALSCTSVSSSSVNDSIKPVAGMRRKSAAAQEVKEPKIPKTFGQKPTFPDFKFPEAPYAKGKNAVPTSQCTSSNERTDVPCERHAVVFREDDSNLATHQEVELPDSFFDVTVDDLRKMLQDLRNESESSDEPLMTSALRAIQRQTEIDKYSRVVIRVKFPNRFIIQGIFRPREKVSALTGFVKSHLQEPDKKFYLYTTPPKVVLAKQEITLFEAKLCPASLVYFGSPDHQEPFLTADYTNILSTPIEAEKLLIETGTRTLRVDTDNHERNSEQGQMCQESSGPPASASAVQNGTSAAKPERMDTDKPVPKWFKGTGKP